MSDTVADDGAPDALLRRFALGPDDLLLVNQARGAAHRLSRALLLVWTRAERVLVSDPASLPAPVIAVVAAQLGVVATALRGYRPSSTTRAADSAATCAHLGVRPFDATAAEPLRRSLLEKSAQTGHGAALLDAADEWLRRHGVLRPTGETTLERLVARARAEAEAALVTQVAGQLTPAQRTVLDALCDTSQGESVVAHLAAPPRHPSATAVLRECQRLQLVRAALPTPIDWGTITPTRRRQWAAVAGRLSAQALRRTAPPRRYTLLLAFLQVRSEEITDAIVDMVDELVGRAFRRSADELDEARAVQVRAHEESARHFRTIAAVLLDPAVPPERVRDEIFRRVPRERVSALVEHADQLERGDLEQFFALLDARYPHLREFTPTVVRTLTFASPRAGNELLEALTVLVQLNAERRRTVPADAPLGFVPPRWARAVERTGGVDRHAWELCLLYQTRAALRAGDLIVAGSRRYAAWDTDLYRDEAWQARRASWYAERGVPEDGAAFMAAAADDLHQVTTAVAARLPANADARVERDKLVVTAPDELPVPPEVALARTRLTARLPWVELAELLMEVDRWTRFTDDLFHLAGRQAPTPRHLAALRPALFAVLVAEATNLGLATMARASGIPEGQLTRVLDWYLREETLRAAITRLIQYHRTLPLTARFGAGTTSSSDAVRFGVAASVLQARHLPRSLGMRRGVSVYGHVSDQGSQFWVDVVSVQVREATYVLNGLVYQDVLPIQEHYVDTHGFTELVTGLFLLLGYRFAPRLRDLPDQVLYRVRKDADYGALEPILRQSIRQPLIIRHWDDLNRVAASLTDGRVVPSHLVSRLQAMRRQNPLQQAIQELGRLGKTQHILSYADDPLLRRRMLVGLNRGERVHQLERVVAFGQQGRFGDRSAAGQVTRASALSLVINALSVWNTRYLHAAAEQLAEQGTLVPAETWQHVTPHLWEHVQLVGRYSFEEPQIEGNLRPLREAAD